ncbi:MAG: RNB domain-containing ribonuclease [Acidobacteria bacterium]|nr:RNB domain-containing ribonuclease [Acidobacteriota bacterium]
MNLIKDEICAYLSRQQSPIGLKRLEQRLKLRRQERNYLRMVLKEMVREGRIQKMENQCYQLAPKTPFGESTGAALSVRSLVTGVLVNGKGGFHVETRTRRKAILARWPFNMQGRPVAGDRVLVLETGKNTGIIAGIEYPNRGRTWGRLRGQRVIPAFGKNRSIFLQHETGKGEVVEALAGIRPRVLARFREVPGSAAVIACYRHNLYLPWPKLAVIPQVEENKLNRRMDLTDLITFTIDGADAKDFDDALSLETVEDGYMLGVHIADVSAYLEQNSPLDQGAMLRGVSVYLPNQTLPMLPEELSNGLCSLVPGEPRLCMSLLFRLNRQFEIEDFRVTPSRIRSRFRLRYDHVNQWLKTDANSKENWVSEIGDSLKILKAFSVFRRKQREKRGAIFLNIPRGELVFTETGQVSGVTGENGGISQRIVEECMLLANETIGNLFMEKKIPGIFRIHPEPAPDTLQALEHLKKELHLDIRFSSVSSFISQLKDPRFHYIILRLMGRARYEGESGYHFGLATSNYLHFTSPIRRYADLVVHRMLKAWLNHVPAPYSRPQLNAIASLVSFRETRAFYGELDTAESLILDKIQREQKREFEGIVSSVSENGIFVELADWFVDGFVPLSKLSGRYRLSRSGFALQDNQGRFISIGSPIRVRIEKIDPLLRSLKLQPVDNRL